MPQHDNPYRHLDSLTPDEIAAAAKWWREERPDWRLTRAFSVWLMENHFIAESESKFMYYTERVLDAARDL